MQKLHFASTLFLLLAALLPGCSDGGGGGGGAAAQPVPRPDVVLAVSGTDSHDPVRLYAVWDDGTTVRLLAEAPEDLHISTWEESPDGRQVAYVIEYEEQLFDLYTGPNIDEGKKSLAYHVLLQSPRRTLTDGDAQKFFKRLERAAGELGGELRTV